MTNDVTFSPCPFCGSSDLELLHKPDPSPPSYPQGAWVIECFGCGALGPFCQEKQNAGASWNGRNVAVEPSGDDASIYLSPEEVRKLQAEKNQAATEALERLGANRPTEPEAPHKLSTVVGLEMFQVGRESYDETPELLPCPCCGSSADYCRSKGSAPFRVECSNCGLNTGFYRKSGQAAAIWNNRPNAGDPSAETSLTVLPKRFSLRYQFDEHRWNWSNGVTGGSGTLAECAAAMHVVNRQTCVCGQTLVKVPAVENGFKCPSCEATYKALPTGEL